MHRFYRRCITFFRLVPCYGCFPFLSVWIGLTFFTKKYIIIILFKEGGAAYGYKDRFWGKDRLYWDTLLSSIVVCITILILLTCWILFD